MSPHFAREGNTKANYVELEDTVLGQLFRKLCSTNLHLAKPLKTHPHSEFWKSKKEGERKFPLPLAYVFSPFFFSAAIRLLAQTNSRAIWKT